MPSVVAPSLNVIVPVAAEGETVAVNVTDAGSICRKPPMRQIGLVAEPSVACASRR